MKTKPINTTQWLKSILPYRHYSITEQVQIPGRVLPSSLRVERTGAGVNRPHYMASREGGQSSQLYSENPLPTTKITKYKMRKLGELLEEQKSESPWKWRSSSWGNKVLRGEIFSGKFISEIWILQKKIFKSWDWGSKNVHRRLVWGFWMKSWNFFLEISLVDSSRWSDIS